MRRVARILKKVVRLGCIRDILACLVFLLPPCGYGQHRAAAAESRFGPPKVIGARRIQAAPKIDGIPDDPCWKDCPVADHFVVYSPRNGTDPLYPSEVRFTYDDQALYVLARLTDPYPDSICRELGKRDQVESLNTDYISIDILPYNDDLNMFEFKVTPANLQNDCKYSAIGADINWDAVWQSGARVTDSGWIAEVRIPWSALRFPAVENQVWGINMWRNLHRRKEYSTWTFVDNTTQDIFRYYGELVGISKIKPPLRLSVTPYVTGYVEKDAGNTDWSYFVRGGLDLRYGINESYTLDMMLIPDFGQVQSDDLVLNLSPFEVQYVEKRQFFTEATELFDKCGIFYSRRVGAAPRDQYVPYYLLDSNEVVTENPDLTRIINATKISGRNAKGLGIGVFNAMTTNTRAVIRDTVTGTKREVMTQPFTNYNVVVVDQNLKNNSYVTLINTNYYIPDEPYMANVTGGETRLCNRGNTLAVFGRLNLSQIYPGRDEPMYGHNYSVSLSKPSGKFRFSAGREEISDTYNPNDMGYLMNNNEARNTLELNYITNDPFWKILSSHSGLIVTYATLYKPYKYTGFRIQASNMTEFSNFWANYLQAGFQPAGEDDYYEPRQWGRFYYRPPSFDFEWRIATDTRKTLRIHNTIGIRNTPGNHNFDYYFTIIPRVRFSDRFTITLSSGVDKNLNDYGWVSSGDGTLQGEDIIFGRRDVTTVNNILTAKYIFSTKLALSLRVRHYWSKLRYCQYYLLEDDGTLGPTGYHGYNDLNYNAFTGEFQFVWYFAPGSEMSVMWKNAIYSQQGEVMAGYFENLGNTLSAPQSNSFSIRILYYIDYGMVRRLFTRNGGASGPK